MTINERVRVYEQAPMREVAGDVIRPGGLALTDHALALCELPVGAVILDIGCGPAVSVEHFIADHQFKAIGLDPSALLLCAGHQRNQALPLVQSGGEGLPIGCNQVDAILTECSLSVMNDMDRALTEFWRVLRPNGYLILSDVYARNPEGVEAIKRLPIDSCLAGAVSQDEVIGQVQAHGFQIKCWEDYTMALKVFTAQLIWAQGSLQQFWCRATSRVDVSDIQAAIAQSKPGYYLLIAQKFAESK